MKLLRAVLLSILTLIPLLGMADCLTADEIQQNGQLVLMGQTSFTHKNESLWRISGSNPYTTDNAYNNISLNVSSSCDIIDDVLAVDFSLYGFGYHPMNEVGLFEEDNSRSKILIDRLKLNATLSENVSLEGGKLRPHSGAFHLRSPAALLTTYYAGFKPTRIFDPGFNATYNEPFWGGGSQKSSAIMHSHLPSYPNWRVLMNIMSHPATGQPINGATAVSIIY
ncbi:hypothetical protein RFC90_001448 [Klebsiella aerogenes]